MKMKNKQIRLIASDIDGTLLQNGEKKIADEVFAQIRRLKEKGILFVAASGRQYHSLRLVFEPVADDILFLCENGAIVYKDNKILTKLPMPRKETLELIKAILAEDGCEALISGANTSYLLPKDDSYVDVIRYGNQNNITLVNSLDEISEDILKVAAYCKDGAQPFNRPLGDPWRDTFHVALAGEQWLDFTTANKGIGMKALVDALGIDFAEVMAFGDNFNDLEMLQQVGYPYVIENCALLKGGYRNDRFGQTQRVGDVLKTL